MARTQTMVQLSEELVAALDREAAEAGVSRSALIRTAISDYLHQRDRDEREQRWIAGYVKTPQLAHDGWGDPTEEAERRGHELAKALDDQESETGALW